MREELANSITHINDGDVPDSSKRVTQDVVNYNYIPMQLVMHRTFTRTRTQDKRQVR